MGGNANLHFLPAFLYPACFPSASGKQCDNFACVAASTLLMHIVEGERRLCDSFLNFRKAFL